MPIVYETLAVRLPKAIKGRVVKRAKKAGLNPSIVVRELINNWLKDEKNGASK